MKNKQAIYLLFAANSISGFAQGVSMIAIPWYFSNVLELPSVFGTIYFLISFVSLFWGLYAGSLIDRINRKYIFIGSSIIGGIVLLSVAYFGFQNNGVPPVLVATVFATTFFIYNIHYPNLFAFAQEITEPKHYGRIISFIEIQGQLSTALAGALSAILLQGTMDGTVTLFGFNTNIGVFIQPWELQKIFLMDGCTYLIAIVLISLIRYQPVAIRHIEKSAIITRIKAGISFLKENKLVFLFGVAAHSIFVAVLVVGFYLKPIYIKNHLHESADVYASFEMYFALGSLIAGIGIASIFRNVSRVAAIIIMSILTAGIFFINVFNTHIAVFYIVSLLLGFSNAGVRIMRMTYLFNHIPNQIIGRTGSVFISINVMFRVFFIFLLSRAMFVQDDNVVYSFGILGVFVLLSAFVLIAFHKRLVATPTQQ